MAILEVTIYFDLICPWCYIGHKSLARAVDLYQRTYPDGRNDEIKYILLPYYLQPDTPLGTSTSAREAVAQKNGAERVNAIVTRLERVGREVGIHFSSDRRIGNTRDSHRLIRFAAEEQRKALLEELYRAHFEEGIDITSRESLATAAESIGLTKDESIDFLNSDQGAAEVDELAAKSRKQARVTSVPTVEIGGRRIEGAEDPGDFYQALVAAKEAILRRTQA